MSNRMFTIVPSSPRTLNLTVICDIALHHINLGQRHHQQTSFFLHKTSIKAIFVLTEPSIYKAKGGIKGGD
jgi:hypothetical protein